MSLKENTIHLLTYLQNCMNIENAAALNVPSEDQGDQLGGTGTHRTLIVSPHSGLRSCV